jgi:hypothetical protein
MLTNMVLAHQRKSCTCKGMFARKLPLEVRMWQRQQKVLWVFREASQDK